MSRKLAIWLMAGAEENKPALQDNMYSVGNNSQGQLGKGDTSASTSFALAGAAGTRNWSAVAASYLSSYALESTGELYSCGYNGGPYNLGLGDTSNRSRFTQIGSDSDWAVLASAGAYFSDGHMAAIKNDGTLWGWGGNSRGQIGVGDTNDRSIPVQVGGDTDWEEVSCNTTNGAGSGFTLARKNDGSIWSWGNDSQGKLGQGPSTGDILSPVQIGTDTDWTSIVAGGETGFAIKDNGTLWAWGDGGRGKLGNGDTLNRSSPVQVGGDTDWQSVDTRRTFTIAVKTDGTLWTWGHNDEGQCGLGDTTDRSSPTQVGTDTDWAFGLAGYDYAFAVKTDGSLWAWGDNSSGQLSSGDQISRSSPVQVGTNLNWTSGIQGANGHTLALRTESS